VVCARIDRVGRRTHDRNRFKRELLQAGIVLSVADKAIPTPAHPLAHSADPQE
jgi:hypothetical protein